MNSPSVQASADRQRYSESGTPGWLIAAAEMWDRAWREGFRIARYRLSREQADELKRISGQDQTLLGRPVVVAAEVPAAGWERRGQYQ